MNKFNGFKEKWQKDKFGPNIVYFHGVRHEFANDKDWLRYEKLHKFGRSEWQNHLHNLNGPAIVWRGGGQNSYYIDGKAMEYETWLHHPKKLIIKLKMLGK